jgi:excisionase family DNA binding protein
MTIYVEFDTKRDRCRTVSVAEAARIWGFSKQTVYDAIKKGIIKAIRISNKRVRISMKEIDRVLDGGIL